METELLFGRNEKAFEFDAERFAGVRLRRLM